MMSFHGSSSRVIQHYSIGTAGKLLGGAGLCYAIQNKKYLHIPIILVFPSAYAGYHVYKNKDEMAEYLF